MHARKHDDTSVHQITTNTALSNRKKQRKKQKKKEIEILLFDFLKIKEGNANEFLYILNKKIYLMKKIQKELQ